MRKKIEKNAKLLLTLCVRLTIIQLWGVWPALNLVFRWGGGEFVRLERGEGRGESRDSISWVPSEMSGMVLVLLGEIGVASEKIIIVMHARVKLAMAVVLLGELPKLMVS